MACLNFEATVEGIWMKSLLQELELDSQFSLMKTRISFNSEAQFDIYTWKSLENIVSWSMLIYRQLPVENIADAICIVVFVSKCDNESFKNVELESEY